MPDLIESKQEFKNAGPGKLAAELFPWPRTVGSFVILLTVLAFTAGWLRNELALTLLGTVFLIILVYCFLGVFLSGIIYHKKGRSLSMSISPDALSAGKNAELCVKTNNGYLPGKNYFRRLPAILMRCQLHLETRDGRVIRHYIDPGKENFSSLRVKERGAYYSAPRLLPGKCNSFVIADAPGFFRISLPLHQDESPDLLALPSPAEEPIELSLKSGGSEERAEAHYRKSDSFTDHRPYIPGDDPRRINWKLYSHTPLEELFVREGEPEPPPHSRLLILVDTEVDGSLYTVDDGRNAVDMLCEIALATALDYQSRGLDICVGFTGDTCAGGRKEEPLDAAELALALALPFAIFRPDKGNPAELPAAPKDSAILILALPRMLPESALERFVKKREENQEADIIFLYDAGSRRAEDLENAAGSCVNLYNGRAGIYAGKAAVLPGQGAEE